MCKSIDNTSFFYCDLFFMPLNNYFISVFFIFCVWLLFFLNYFLSPMCLVAPQFLGSAAAVSGRLSDNSRSMSKELEY